MYCKHLKLKLNKKISCNLTNKQITLSDCNKCTLFQTKGTNIVKHTQNNKNTATSIKTPIKRVSNKLIKAERNRYSIITNDLKHCIECNSTNTYLHEVFYGANRQQSIKYGCVIPLCDLHHTNNTNNSAIHHNKQMCDKWHKKVQLQWMLHYNKTEQEFINVFKKSYLEQKKEEDR